MNKFIHKKIDVIRGVPSAVFLSALFHFILLFIAGGLVVFTVIKKEEKKFVPTKPVERPKMELKKPRVKVRKTSAPRTKQRITAKNIQRAMPNIQLPEVSGLSSGLGGGLGGFEMMPDSSEMTLFGWKNSFSVGNDFEGTFFTLSMDRQGRKNGMGEGDQYYRALGRFYAAGWNPRALAMYYRAPQKLYTTFFYIPMSASEMVPRSFGIPDDVYTLNWCAYYKGKFASKTGGKFRFWGRGENVLAVRVNGKEVLQGGHILAAEIASDWRSTAPEHRKYYRGHGPMGVGDWFDLKPGVPAELEVVFGDTGGAWTQATLTIQEFGKEYPTNEDGAPILPVFKTAEIPQHLIDEIQHSMIEGEASFDGPLFNMY